MAENSAGTFVPNPPRRSGDPEQDINALFAYVQQLWQKGIVEGGLVVSSGQFSAGDFNPADLPDPASATIASAQQTANEAYALASNAKALAQRLITVGTLGTSGATATGSYTFTAADGTPQADANYVVVACPVGIGGTPAANSREIKSITKSTTGFTLESTAAPGVGNTVTWGFIVARV